MKGTIKKQNTDRLFQELALRECIGAALWGLLGCGQIVLGILFFWPTIVVGALNILAVPSRLRQSQTVKARAPGLLKDYNDWRIRILINLALNVALGMGIGLVGSIYDVILRRFVANHVRELQPGLQQADG